MSGFITIERSLFEHEFFDDEPMSEREAWVWMLARARWKDGRHKVGLDMYDVQRGSFMATLREMQSKFMWRSDTKVRNFLKRLEKEGMIERTTAGSRNAPKTHVTICNYEEYQASERTENVPKTHRERTKNAVKKQGNKLTREIREEDTSVSLQVSPASDAAQAVRIFNAASERAGWPVVQKITPNRSRAMKARLADAGGIDGWVTAIEKAEASDFLCGRTSNPWTAFGFDWLVKSQNFTKLMEGNYDNRDNTGGRFPSGGVGSGTVDAFAAVAHERKSRKGGGGENY